MLAGIDPVALDYYASKHVLLPLGGYNAQQHDPDSFSGLINHLTGARDFINANGGIGGEPTNLGDDNIEVISTSDGDGDDIIPDLNGEEGKGGCFIATAVCGSRLAKDVKVLSKVRDEYLLANSLGRAFVSFYYRYGPKLADFISKYPFLKRAIRIVLRSLVMTSRLIIEKN